MGKHHFSLWQQKLFRLSSLWWSWNKERVATLPLSSRLTWTTYYSMETPETTREISDRHDGEAISIAIVSEQINGLKELVITKLGFQDIQLALIKEQTTKTNGKVADAVKDIDKLKIWRGVLTGAWAMITIFVVPVMMFLLYKRLQ